MMTLAMPQESLACWPYTMRVARAVVRRNHDIAVPHWIGRVHLIGGAPRRLFGEPPGRDAMITESPAGAAVRQRTARPLTLPSRVVLKMASDARRSPTMRR